MNRAAWALVIKLLTLGSPTTVARLIVAVIVDTVNRKVRPRSWPHVFDECFERVTPPITDRNSASSVVTELGVLGIEAALFHAFPTAVALSATSFTLAVRPAKLSYPLRRGLDLHTPATASLALPQTSTPDDSRLTTIAMTIPHWRTVPRSARATEHRPSTKPHPCEIPEVLAGVGNRAAPVVTGPAAKPCICIARFHVERRSADDALQMRHTTAIVRAQFRHHNCTCPSPPEVGP